MGMLKTRKRLHFRLEATDEVGLTSHRTLYDEHRRLTANRALKTPIPLAEVRRANQVVKLIASGRPGSCGSGSHDWDRGELRVLVENSQLEPLQLG
jgi:hypothetical protein